jgi:hypothetical protein
MIRNVESRLLKLEAARSPLDSPWRRVIGDTETECQTKRRAMIEAGQAQEADRFIFRIIIDPVDRCQRENDLQRAPTDLIHH